MSQAERGLFDQISDLVPLPNWPEIEDICIAFELAYSGLKNALEHERKSHHAAQDRIVDLEQRLAEAERRMTRLRELYIECTNNDYFGEVEGEEEPNIYGNGITHEQLDRFDKLTAPQQEQKL